jgi:hypothetical protein
MFYSKNYVQLVIFLFVFYTHHSLTTKGEFEDTKGVIRIRKSKKNWQHNGPKRIYKKTNNDLQNIHIKLKIE